MQVWVIFGQLPSKRLSSTILFDTSCKVGDQRLASLSPNLPLVHFMCPLLPNMVFASDTKLQDR